MDRQGKVIGTELKTENNTKKIMSASLITIGEFSLEKTDPLNWTLTRAIETTRKQDVKRRDGSIASKKGEEYTQEVFIGFYGSLEQGLLAIVKESLGVDCSGIQDILQQIKELKEDIASIKL